MATNGVTSETSGSSQTNQSSGNGASKNSLDSLDTSEFLKMMIAELQNQDPLNPMDNQQILQQVSQIRSIQSSTQLTQTLQSVMLGQNVSTASSLIGKQIQGLTADGKAVNGLVERVSIKDGVPSLYVGEDAVSLTNVSEIQPLFVKDAS